MKSRPRAAKLSPAASATVTVEEAAELLNISRTVAYNWLAGPSPLIPHQRRGTRFVIFRADVLAIAERGLAAIGGHAVDAPAANIPRPSNELATALGELLAGRTVEFTLTTPLGPIEGRVTLPPTNGQSRRP